VFPAETYSKPVLHFGPGQQTRTQIRAREAVAPKPGFDDFIAGVNIYVAGVMVKSCNQALTF
jgi:hypothetical protein